MLSLRLRALSVVGGGVLLRDFVLGEGSVAGGGGRGGAGVGFFDVLGNDGASGIV